MEENLDRNNEQPQPAQKELAEELLWDGYEYEFVEKTKDWYWMIGSIGLLIIIIALLTSNYLLALIIVLSGFILVTHAKREPRLITYGLTRRGVKHGETIFLFSSLQSFWVDEQRNQLTIESSRLVKPHIYIPLADTDPAQVRQLLKKVVREKEFHGSFGDFVTDFFGF
ncbi:MAG: hypothetical protein NTY66_03060 [Candidatus Vogelbacteria bacterium]|nr:hypothetical protein [Candidatus Vogelbacteria bacterium]